MLSSARTGCAETFSALTGHLCLVGIYLIAFQSEPGNTVSPSRFRTFQKAAAQKIDNQVGNRACLLPDFWRPYGIFLVLRMHALEDYLGKSSRKRLIFSRQLQGDNFRQNPSTVFG